MKDSKPGPKPRHADADVLRAARQYGVNEAARRLGMSQSNMSRRLDTLKQREAPQPDSVPDRERGVDELLAHREAEWDRRNAHERAVADRRIKFNTSEPVAIVHMGDPHLDNPGTDIRTIRRHVEVINATPGMYGANVGDFTDNWIGKLAHLYSQSTVTAKEALKLAEWFVRSTPWAYLIGGNHDAWGGGDNALAWFAKQQHVAFQPTQIRFRATFANGAEFHILARHHFKGHSMYSPGHGVARAAKLGKACDVLAGGHIHSSDYRQVWNEDQQVLSHCLQVGSYKRWDDYATVGQFEACWTPAMVTVLDPRTLDPLRRVTVLFSVEEAADYLTWLRGKRKAA